VGRTPASCNRPWISLNNGSWTKARKVPPNQGKRSKQ
jgi:hypothetical protein